MTVLNADELKPEMFFHDRFRVGRREDFEVIENYCYFDYSHEEILAAVLCGREVAVGTLVVESALDETGTRFKWTEAAAMIDPQVGVWIIAKMFDGFDFEAWERATKFRDEILLALEASSDAPVWVAGVVLGAKRADILIPDSHAAVVFGEDEVPVVYDRIKQQQSPTQEAAALCHELLEFVDFLDAKDTSDIREIPSWLDQRLS